MAIQLSLSVLGSTLMQIVIHTTTLRVSPNGHFGPPRGQSRNARHLPVCTGKRPMAAPRPVQGACGLLQRPEDLTKKALRWKVHQKRLFQWTFQLSAAPGQSRPSPSPCGRATKWATAAHCCHSHSHTTSSGGGSLQGQCIRMPTTVATLTLPLLGSI